jgi:hypothetical protein
MKKVKNWDVCFEVGLNHLGSYTNILSIIQGSMIQNLSCSLSVQIREESFYDDSKRYLALNSDVYVKLREFCRSLGIPFGLALGPLENLDWLTDLKLHPDFIKPIGIGTNDLDFVERLNEAFTCPKYYSVGLSEYGYIREEIIPRMRDEDMLVHTSLSHESSDQNLSEIRFLESLGKIACFGQHASSPEVCFAAIGAGAKKIFAYIGDKDLELPDKAHAVAICDAISFYNQCSNCFAAMKKIESGFKSAKIDFIG